MILQYTSEPSPSTKDDDDDDFLAFKNNGHESYHECIIEIGFNIYFLLLYYMENDSKDIDFSTKLQL